MFLTDTLSGAYLEGEKLTVHSIKEWLFAFELEQIKRDEELTVSPTRLERLREETAKDEELQILSNVIRKGWTETLAQARENDKRQKQVIELYWNSWDELTTEDGLVLLAFWHCEEPAWVAYWGRRDTA